MTYIWWFLSLITIGLVGYFLVTTPLIRFLKTGWLIIRTEPYQQAGSGAGAILVVGDSTAYGTGARRPNESIAGLVGQTFPAYRIRTVAKNGATIEGVTKLLGEQSLGDYSLILIQAGGNDILQKHSVAEIEQDARELLIQATAASIPVVLMTAGNVGAAPAFTTQGVPDADYEARSRTTRALLMRLALEYKVFYVDLFEEPSGDTFLSEPHTYLAIDGLHPSSAGYQQWFDKLQPVLERVLSE